MARNVKLDKEAADFLDALCEIVADRGQSILPAQAREHLKLRRTPTSHASIVGAVLRDCLAKTDPVLFAKITSQQEQKHDRNNERTDETRTLARTVPGAASSDDDADADETHEP